MSEREAIGGNHPPAETNPEKLIDVAALPALLDANYAGLRERQAELEKGMAAWAGQHPGAAIRDDADNDRTSDFLRQLDGFAGDKTGEVEVARAKVKGPVFQAGKTIDAWFAARRDVLRAFVAEATKSQTLYLRAKVAKERAAAAAEADRARKLAARAALEQASERSLFGPGLEASVAASEAAREAEERAEGPARDLVRSRSDIGTTTTLRTAWQWRVVDGDLMPLVRAVASGEAPLRFLTTAGAEIGGAVRGGLRTCPGLHIWAEETATRR